MAMLLWRMPRRDTVHFENQFHTNEPKCGSCVKQLPLNFLKNKKEIEGMRRICKVGV